jgi:uncharacterized protein (PEP-CTERM system associated)
MQATPKLAFDLEYSERFQVYADDGLAKTRQAKGTVNYAGKIETNFSVFASETDYQLEDRKDREAGGALFFRIPLRDRLDLRLNGSVAFYEYLPENEDGHRVRTRASLNYLGRLFDASLGFAHLERISDVDSNEYRNNIVFLEATVRFGRSITDYKESQIYQESPEPEEQLPFSYLESFYD